MPTTAFQHALSSIGYVPDLAHGDQAPQAWDDGHNVRFVRGAPRTVEGMATAYTATTTVVHAMNAYNATANFWAYATLTALYATDGSTTSNITRISASTTVIPYGATANQNWVSASFGNYMVLNNGVDKPQAWALGLSNKATDLSNWPATWALSSRARYSSGV